MIAGPDLLHQDRATSESAATSIVRICPMASTPASGGTPAFPITMPATAQPQPMNWALQMKWWIDSIAKGDAAIKVDDVSLKLQNES